MDGIMGILVLSDTVHVIELQTNTEVDVPAGEALIVVPGEPVGEPFSVTDKDINPWWKNPSSSGADQSGTRSNLSGNKDFNPIPGINGETIYWGGWLILAIIYLVIFVVKIVKK
jgi:hypothetical protein